MTRSCLFALRRQLLLASTCLVASGGLVGASAGVTGFSGQGGTISQPNPQTTIIHQTTDKAIFNVTGFDIRRGESVVFQQPGAGAIALTRVRGSTPSQIDGSLVANGRVWIVNPLGVIFGANAVVNVGGLLATTADIRDADFLNGIYNFGIASPYANAAIVNRGTITASAGEVVLAGARVVNQGTIVADAGTVVLAGGKTFAVDFAGDKLLRFAVTAPVDTTPLDDSGKPADALVANSGMILADGGKVVMTARAAKGVVDNVINTSGIVEAKTASLVNGEIVLDGGSAGTVQVSGTLDASGKSAGETGGKVKVFGETVSLASTARIDVSGDAGGGVAEIGGEAHGAGPSHAETTLIAGGALVTADALTRGNGGSIIVWSEAFTNVAGTLTARGGALGGDGGFIETSSHGALGIAPGASVLTSARFGQGGQWLLDPFDLTIANATQVNVAQTAGAITPTATGATVDAAVLDAALNAGSSIAVRTDVAAGGEAGDINVNAPITMTAAPGSPTTLTLTAAGSVFVNQPITTTNGALVVAIQSGALGPTGSINLGADIVANQVTLTANGPINQLGSAVINTLGGPLAGSSLGGATLIGPNLIGSIATFTNTGSGDVFIQNQQSLQVVAANSGPGALTFRVTGGGLTINGASAANGINLIADQLIVSAAATISGQAFVSPATSGAEIDLGVAAARLGVLALSQSTLAALASPGNHPLVIATSGPINVVSPVIINAPLNLIGSDINLTGLSINSGGLFIGATGAVTGSVNLAAGTGPALIQSFSTNISGTFNGQTGAAGAAEVLQAPPFPGSGPFLVNGIVIALAPAPPAPTIDPPPAAALPPSVITPPPSAPPASASGDPADPTSSSSGGASSPQTASADGESSQSSPASTGATSASSTGGAELAAAAGSSTMVFAALAPPPTQPVVDIGTSDAAPSTGDALASAVAQPLQTAPAPAPVPRRPSLVAPLLGGLLGKIEPSRRAPAPRGPSASDDFSIWGNEARW